MFLEVQGIMFFITSSFLKGYKSAALFLQEALEERVEVVKAAGAKSGWAGGMSYNRNVRLKNWSLFEAYVNFSSLFFWGG